MDKNKIFIIFGIVSITVLFFSHRNYKKREEDHSIGIVKHESCNICETSIEGFKKFAKRYNLKEDLTEDYIGKIKDGTLKLNFQTYADIIQKMKHEKCLNNQFI